jgi:hypothetical protein
MAVTPSSGLSQFPFTQKIVHAMPVIKKVGQLFTSITESHSQKSERRMRELQLYGFGHSMEIRQISSQMHSVPLKIKEEQMEQKAQELLNTSKEDEDWEVWGAEKSTLVSPITPQETSLEVDLELKNDKIVSSIAKIRLAHF